jgi:F-type H+-transporting ATPase subunit delta
MSTSLGDKYLGVARVYSDALMELAESQDAIEPLEEELQQLAAQVERDPDLRAFLESPLVATDQRRDALEHMFRGRLSDLLVDGLQVMNRKGRIGLLPEVAYAYHEALNERLGRVEVRVSTAVPLDEEQRRHIESTVASTLGKKPVLQESVDESLIGGIVFQIGDRKIDGSVATQLETLSEDLLTRASREHVEAYVER